VAAREGAERQAGRPVGVKESEEQDESRLTAVLGAQAELPPGVPVWSPRVFLARERTYTKGSRKYHLKQGEAHRYESNPQIAEATHFLLLPFGWTTLNCPLTYVSQLGKKTT
jgi:hypothetical protein